MAIDDSGLLPGTRISWYASPLMIRDHWADSACPPGLKFHGWSLRPETKIFYSQPFVLFNQYCPFILLNIHLDKLQLRRRKS